jgi:hypothetical protein
VAGAAKIVNGPASRDLTRVAALAIELRSQLSHRAPSALADFTLRLSSCRFHERNFQPNWEQQKALENDAFSRA